MGNSPPDTPAGERTRLLHPPAKAKQHHNLAGLSPLRFWLCVLSLWSFGFLVSLDATVVATLLTDIGSNLNASNRASWLGTAYLLSLCCFTPIYGRLADAIGKRSALLIGGAIFTVGTFLCGLAPSMTALIAARALTGLGGGGCQTVPVMILNDLVDLRHRGLFQGWSNIFFGLGGALGGPVGGILSDAFGWRVAFLAQIPLLVTVSILVYTLVHIPARSSPGVSAETQGWRPVLARIDYFGSLTLALAIGGLVLGVSFKTSSARSDGTDYRWSDPLIAGLLVGSAVFTVVFILVEKLYAVQPILPLELLLRRTPLSVALSSLVMVANQFSLLYNVPLYFSAVRLTSSSVAGAHLLPYSGLFGLGSLTVGFVIRRSGKYKAVSLVSASFMILSSALFLTWNRHTAEWLTWTAQIPSGLGYTGTLTSSLVALMTNVAIVGKGENAVATAMVYMFRMIGQVLGVALSSAVIQAIISKDLSRLITGPGAPEIIYTIRHSTSSIRHMAPAHRDAAVQAYDRALHVVFICNLVLSGINMFALLIMKDEEMPDQARLRPEEEEERPPA